MIQQDIIELGFPLVDLQSCEVMGDFRYRHTMLYIYATKSDYQIDIKKQTRP